MRAMRSLSDPAVPPDYLQPVHAAHNRISFYTWSDDRCCLARGATSATLKGSYPDLLPGDALLFEEVLGPNTGLAGDADPRHRHVVRLTSVLPTAPAVETDPLTGEAVTEIAWALADALPFALCISGVTDDAHGAEHLADISVGTRQHGSQGRPWPARGTPATISARCRDRFLFALPGLQCRPAASRRREPRSRRAIGRGWQRCADDPGGRPARRHPVRGRLGTLAGPFASAAAVGDWSMEEVFPQVVLDSALDTRKARWHAQRDLLSSAGDSFDFVAEIDDDGDAQLRFGDDEHGQRPDSGTAFAATYRIGNGAAGNVGADAIVHIVGQPADLAKVLSLRNPLPAAGGVDPESADSVRRNAPEAFRTQERAVTTDDYAAVVERDPQVQRAAATLRWTASSRYTVLRHAPRPARRRRPAAARCRPAGAGRSLPQLAGR